MQPPEIVLLGTRTYGWAVNIFAHLFRKYWGDQEIIWYGDSLDGPIPGGVRFKRVPAYAEGVWPWEPWFSNGLRSILADLDGFTVALFLPDHWLASPVDHGAVKALAGYMDEKGTVVRGNLTCGTCLDGYGKHVATRGNYEIVSVRPDNAHCGLQGGITFTPSLWNRALLCDLLEPHWNLWRMESEGTKRMIKLSPTLLSVGTRPGALYRCHGLHHERPGKVSIEGLCQGDADFVRSMLPVGWSVA